MLRYRRMAPHESGVRQSEMYPVYTCSITSGKLPGGYGKSINKGHAMYWQAQHTQLTFRSKASH